MAARGGAIPKAPKKRSASEFPSEKQQEEIAKFCTPGEGPTEGSSYETNIDQANVPLKVSANVRTVVGSCWITHVQTHHVYLGHTCLFQGRFENLQTLD